MATLEGLEARKELVPLAMPKITPQKRKIWLFPRVEEWFRQELGILNSFYEDQARPDLQAWILLGNFIRGEELYEGEDFWLMRPYEADVFELKSPDLRFFGWFVRPKNFIIAAVDTFANTHGHDLHDGYRNEVVRMRETLDLDEPKVMVGAKPSDVF